MSHKKPYFSFADNRRQDPSSGITPKYSYGLAVPRGSLMACLCVDKNTYSRKCCKGYLLNQGIGNIYGTEPVYDGSFSIAFNSGFQGGQGTAHQI
jgi:hypothetical protein